MSAAASPVTKCLPSFKPVPTTYDSLKQAIGQINDPSKRSKMLGEGTEGYVTKITLNELSPDALRIRELTKSYLGGFPEYESVIDVNEIALKCLESDKELSKEYLAAGIPFNKHVVPILGAFVEIDGKIVFKNRSDMAIRPEEVAGKVVALVMPHIESTSLEHVIERAPCTLPEEEILSYVSGLRKGMQHLHESGFVHRDVKPANVLIVDDLDGPTPMLADFGFLQKLSDPDSLRCGTMGYTAPEVLRGGDIGISSDYWSFGVTVLETITREYLNLPSVKDAEDFFEDRDMFGSVPEEKLMHGSWRFDPEVHELFDQIITRCTIIDPRKRVKEFRAYIASISSELKDFF
jgi:serine/threonine protein kinase